MRIIDKNRRLTDKLNYLIEYYIDGGVEELALKTFGYERQNAVSNLCSNRPKTSTIRKIHMESIQAYHKIPMAIWKNTIPFDKTILDNMIAEYRLKLKQKKQLENTSGQMINNPIFQKNEKLFNKLKGVWYAYLYPSNPKSASETEGVWIVETTIYDDYTVKDYWDNAGYLKLGKNESLIIKESYDNNDLTVIRFPNRQVPSQHFRFTIVSNQNNTTTEMVNFGFYSRKRYTPKEAKEILGDMNKVQLKLDLDFNDRINRQGIVPD